MTELKKEWPSTEERVDLIGQTVKEATYEGIVNPMLLDIYFNVNIILLYSDIEVTDEERSDKLALLDKFNKDKVPSAAALIGDEEFDMLSNYLEQWSKAEMSYKNSIVGIMENLKSFFSLVEGTTLDNVDALKQIDFSGITEALNLAGTLGFKPEVKK